MVGNGSSLSLSQKDVFFEAQIFGHKVNNIGGYLDIQSPINVSCFNTARDLLFAQHDAFRISIDIDKNQAVQRVQSGLFSDLLFLDFCKHDEPNKAALQWMDEIFNSPFENMSQGLVVDALLKIDNERYFYFAKAHHIIMDGWGYALWGQNLIQLYKQSIGELSDDQATQPLSYLDVIEKQQYEGSIRYRKDQAFWLNQFTELPAPLFTKRTDEVELSHRVSLNLPVDKYRRLVELADKIGCGVLSLFLAAIYTYVHRCFDTEDIAIGLPSHNRRTKEEKSVIGLLVNMNVINPLMSGENVFSELAQTIAGQLKKSYRHNRYPISHLNRDLQLLKENREQLFDITFNYQKLDLSLSLATGHIDCHFLNNRYELTPLAFTLCEYDDAREVKFHLDYLESYADQIQVEWIMERLSTLFDSILERPDDQVKTLNLLSEKERELLESLPRTAALGTKKNMATIFEHLVIQKPENVAVKEENFQLNYRQLNSQANRLARLLIQNGLRKGEVVAISGLRSSQLIVAIVAVLKAGGCYMPLDTEYPLSRQLYMLKNAQIRLAISCEKSPSDSLTKAVDWLLLKSDVIKKQLAELPDENLNLPITAEDPAYLIYTSGSTGKSKGVQVSHGNNSSYVAAANKRYALNAPRVLGISSVSFDIFVEELGLSIFSGGSLFLAEQKLTLNTSEFWQMVEKERIECVSLPTAYWHMLCGGLDEGSAEVAKSHLISCIVGGEEMQLESAKHWLGLVGSSVALWNTYGPTETSVVASGIDLSQLDLRKFDSLPIGSGFEHCSLYVLDKQMQPQPIGCSGELYIGGPGVALGYIQQNELTEQSFIESGTKPEERLYRTGDKVCWRFVNGSAQLMFLGRLDTQVKFQGYRVELSELSQQLMLHSEVNDALVNVVGEGSNKRLVAYLQLADKNNEKSIISACKTTLRRTLPSYMQPSDYVVLTSIPLTPNGKVDYVALSAAFSPAEIELRGQEPRDQLELTLSEIYSKVLGVPNITLEDNFFELGGHSLSALQLSMEVKQTFRLDVSLATLFEHSSLAELAEYIRNCNEVSTNELPLTKQNLTKGSLQLSFSQQRIWFVDQLEDDKSIYNMPGMIALNGSLDFSSLEQALKQLVNRHQSLQTGFIKQGTEVKPVIYSDSVPIIHTHDYTHMSETKCSQAIDKLAEVQLNTPFKLEKAPLLRAHLIKLSEDKHILFVCLHHIISDGWSINILMSELKTAYRNIVEQQPDSLPPLPIQYTDYVHWQRQYFDEKTLEPHMQYWLTQLADVPDVHSLPTDFSRPAVQSFRGKKVSRTLNSEQLSILRTFCQSQNVTLFMVLHTIYGLLLNKYGNADDIVIGTQVSGRTHKALEGLIGLFVNTIALRTKVDGYSSFSQALEQSKLTVLNAFTHDVMPFEMIVEKLNPIRSLSYSPIVQLGLNLQDNSNSNLNFGDVDAEFIESKAFKVKYDLDLNVEIEDDQLRMDWIFNTSLFTSTTVARMADNFVHLMFSAIENQNLSVNQLNYISPQELNKLEDFATSDTPSEAGTELLHHLIDNVAKSFGTNTALQCAGKTVNYSELVDKTDKMASALQYNGVKPGDMVGVCLNRSVESIVSIIAIWKIGATYVPITPELPVARKGYIIDDAQIRLLLCDQGSERSLVNITCPVLNITKINEYSGNGYVSYEGNEEHYGYVIYTSGTTGKPKGVAVSYRNFSQMLQSCANQFCVQKQDVMPCLAALSFDISLFEVFMVLIKGGTSVIVPQSDIEDLAKLRLHIKSATLLHAVPALMRVIIDQLDAKTELPKLRMAYVGGDKVANSLLNDMQLHFNKAQIVELYGPTETTIISTAWLLTSEVVSTNLQIGRPLNHAKTFVVGKDGSLAPIGAIGELYIGGIGVASGYLNNKELTSKYFVKCAFAQDERLYRTGDLVRYTEDGNLEFIGRDDNQVKIRGFRIELDEINSVLVRHEKVKDAFTAVRKLASGGEQLISFYLPNECETVETDKLESLLKQELPDYMLPSSLIAIKTIPLTNHGKVDIKALLTLAESTSSNIEADRTGNELEKHLQNLWQSAFNLEVVGLKDNFFNLGGHSILAIQLVAEINNALCCELSVKQLFLNPTIEQLANHIEQTVTKGAEQTDRDKQLEVDLSSRHEPFPLTAIQQSYYIGRSNLFELGNISSHSYQEVELNSFDYTKFNFAWNELIKRHDMLRVSFDPQMQQKISPWESDYRIRQYDFRGGKTSDVAAGLYDIRQEMSHQVLDTSLPMFDLRISYTDDKTRLHVSFDALNTDDWSINNLVRELLIIYYEGTSQNLKPLQLSFRDYVLFQKKYMEGPKYEKAKSYWLNRIEQLPMAPQLPMAKNSNEIKTPTFIRRSLKLEPSKWQAIKTFAQSDSITPSATLLTIYSDMLANWSKVRHFTLNLTLLNRLACHPDVNDLVGNFSSSLLLEVDLRQQKAFIDKARTIQQQFWQDLEFQDFCGVSVIRELSSSKGNSGKALMPVIFTSTLGFGEETFDSELFNIDIEDDDNMGGAQTPQAWMVCHVSESNGALELVLDTIDELFPASMIEDMFDSMSLMLKNLADDTALWQQTRWQYLPQQQQDLINSINKTNVPPSSILMHQLFEHNVARSKDSIAVKDGHHSITYHGLEKLSEHLASKLKALGARPNKLIAVTMEKGWQQIVAVMGILKTGAAYMPIDVNLPQGRIDQLLKQGQVDISINDQFAQNNILFTSNISCVSIEMDWQYLPVTSASNEKIDLSNLAYVIFTSGSTGLPKGVMIDHKGAVNTITDINRRFGITKDDCVLALSSLSFDLSVYDIFGLLGVGGTVALPDCGAEIDPKSWLQQIERDRVSVWNSAPQLMQLFTQYLEHGAESLTLEQVKEKLASIRVVMMSGDWIPTNLGERIKLFMPQCDIYSLGGATEASIWSIFHPIEGHYNNLPSIPYGKPLDNQRFYVLDEGLNPCPVWVPGELYIAGDGLALGYWQDHNRTAASFVINPESGERLYRTSDSGRFLPNGDIEFLGRLDQQIKIRGFRVEIGEIEHNLLQHQSIKRSMVLAKTDTSGNNLLLAFIIPETTNNLLKESELKAFLAEKLPDYMIPVRFVVLEHFPLTENGKVDRKALLQSCEVDSVENKVLEQPSTAVERDLLKLWQDILQKEDICVNDNFFELGGHSLLASNLALAIKNKFVINLSLRSIFENPTIAELAIEVGKVSTVSMLPEIEVIERDGLMPLSYAQKRIWLIDQIEGSSAQYNIISGFHIRGQLDVNAFESAIKTVQQRHEILTTNYLNDGLDAWQKIATIHSPVINILDCRYCPNIDRESHSLEVLNQQVNTSIDLTSEPVMSVTLLQYNNDNFCCIFKFHHIAFDANSIGIFFAEFSALYNAVVNGEELELKPLELQYADFAYWQNRWLHGEVLQQHVDYWKNQLADIPLIHSLPTDKVRPNEQSYKADSVLQVFDKQFLDEIKGFCHQGQFTPYMLLISAYSVLLARYSNQQDIVIGTPVDGRNQKSLESLIGFFVNTAVIRANCDGTMSVSDFMQKQKSTILEAFEHQNLPFQLLVDELKVPRSLSINPVFQIMFSMHNSQRTEFALDGLSIQQVQGEQIMTQFDLNLNVKESSDMLELNWVFAKDLFDRETIVAMTQHYKLLLKDILARPNAKLNNLNLLSQTSYQQLLTQSTGQVKTNKETYVGENLLHCAFERQAEKHGGNIAIEFGGQKLSFSELNSKANKLAHKLIELGCSPEQNVGLCMSRTADMIVSVLAILKAGCAYVPVDINLPPLVIKKRLDKADIKFLVIDSERLELGQSMKGAIVNVDEQDLLNVMTETNPNLPLTADTSAYLLFTSGSTGEPKGIDMPHKALSNLVNSVRLDEKRLNGFIKTMLFSSIGFDMSFLDIFLALNSGGSVVVIDEVTKTDIAALMSVIENYQVSVLNLPYAMLQTLTQYANSRNIKLDNVDVILSTAEQLKITDDIKKFFIQNDHIQLINHYGPTETHVVTTQVMSGEPESWLELPPIGKPLANVNCYVLDEQMNLCPQGVVGELYIGGVALAKGYYDQPKLTAEKFICSESPFGKDEILYRTGDHVRWMNDGVLQYIGRIDHQVKIRGFRIEFGEIEAVLIGSNQVNQVVLICTDEPAYLIAYVIPSKPEVCSDNLLQYCRAHLPDYMVPHAIVMVNSFELNVNGKVDRSKLPNAKDLLNVNNHYKAPSKETEKMLCQIWQELLNVEQVGVNDDFFELGGNSLLLTTMLTRVYEEWSVEIPVKLLFEHQSIEELAILIEDERLLLIGIDDATEREQIEDEEVWEF